MAINPLRIPERLLCISAFTEIVGGQAPRHFHLSLLCTLPSFHSIKCTVKQRFLNCGTRNPRSPRGRYPSPIQRGSLKSLVVQMHMRITVKRVLKDFVKKRDL